MAGNVNAEMGLNVLDYNLKRDMHILGFQLTMKATVAMGGRAHHFLSNAPHVRSGPVKRQ